MSKKEIKLAFIIIDVKSSYFITLGRDWIHTGKYMSLTLHQRLTF